MNWMVHGSLSSSSRIIILHATSVMKDCCVVERYTEMKCLPTWIISLLDPCNYNNALYKFNIFMPTNHIVSWLACWTRWKLQLDTIEIGLRLHISVLHEALLTDFYLNKQLAYLTLCLEPSQRELNSQEHMDASIGLLNMSVNDCSHINSQSTIAWCKWH